MAASFKLTVAAGILAAGISAGAPALAAQDATFIYTALGDSSGVGVGAREGGYVAHVFAALNDRHPRSRLINLCRSGASTQGVLSEQVPRVPSANQGVITIGIGVNDLSRQVPVTQFADRLEAIARGVKARSQLPVVISNLPDVSQAPVLPLPLRPVVAEQVRRYNRVIADVAERHRWVLADIYSVSQKEIPRHPEFFSDDGFHPSDAGYRFWAENLQPRIDSAITRPLP